MQNTTSLSVGLVYMTEKCFALDTYWSFVRQILRGRPANEDKVQCRSGQISIYRQLTTLRDEV